MDVHQVFNELKAPLGGDEDFLPKAILLSAVQLTGLNPTSALLDEAIEEVGGVPDDKLTFNEFSQICQKLEPTRLDEKALQGAFEVFDVDGNGYLDRDEFATLLQSGNEPLSDEEITYALTMADIDGDGKINYAEFVHMLCHSQRMKQVIEDAKVMQHLSTQRVEVESSEKQTRQTTTSAEEEREWADITAKWKSIIDKTTMEKSRNTQAKMEKEKPKDVDTQQQARSQPPEQKAKGGCCAIS